MILQKEWLDRAEKNAEETTPITGNQTLYSTAINAARYDYIQGATEMLMAVEALVKENIEQVRKDLKETKDKDVILGLLGEDAALTVIQNELKSIKPLTDV